jgi:hypothetical protein
MLPNSSKIFKNFPFHLEKDEILVEIPLKSYESGDDDCVTDSESDTSWSESDEDISFENDSLENESFSKDISITNTMNETELNYLPTLEMYRNNYRSIIENFVQSVLNKIENTNSTDISETINTNIQLHETTISKNGKYCLTNAFFLHIDQNKQRYSKIYEILCALKHYFILWDDVPPCFSEIYNLPHLRDYGIDLIDLEVTKSAQVKYYSNTMVTWSSIGTFTNYSQMLNIPEENRYLFTTNSAKIEKMVYTDTGMCLFHKARNNVQRSDFKELLEYALQIPLSKTNVKKIVKKIEQRSYIVQATNKFFASFKKILKYQLPCGSGKSFLIFDIICKDMLKGMNEQYLILTPQIELCDQLQSELEKLEIDSYCIHSKTTKQKPEKSKKK